MFVTIVAFVLAVLRVAGFTSIAFQGLAHLFVGGLGGAWLVGRNRLYLILFLAMTAVETLCFFLL